MLENPENAFNPRTEITNTFQEKVTKTDNDGNDYTEWVNRNVFDINTKDVTYKGEKQKSYLYNITLEFNRTSFGQIFIDKTDPHQYLHDSNDYRINCDDTSTACSDADLDLEETVFDTLKGDVQNMDRLNIDLKNNTSATVTTDVLVPKEGSIESNKEWGWKSKIRFGRRSISWGSDDVIWNKNYYEYNGTDSLSINDIKYYNGKVIIGNADSSSSVAALDESDGSILWQHSLHSDFFTAEIAAAEGVVYSHGTDGIYAADSSDGSELWHRSIDPKIIDFHNTKLYVLSSNNIIYALDTNQSGQTIWTFDASTSDFNDARDIAVNDNKIIIGDGTSSGMYTCVGIDLNSIDTAYSGSHVVLSDINSDNYWTNSSSVNQYVRQLVLKSDYVYILLNSLDDDNYNIYSANIENGNEKWAVNHDVGNVTTPGNIFASSNKEILFISEYGVDEVKAIDTSDGSLIASISSTDAGRVYENNKDTLYAGSGPDLSAIDTSSLQPTPQPEIQTAEGVFQFDGQLIN